MKQAINGVLKKTNKIKTFGNSMFPLLVDGDVVFFKKTAFKDIFVNDIIIFQQNNRYVTHRVIYKTGQYLVTKGDNNLKADGKIYKKDIVGKLEYVKRGNIEFHPEVYYAMQSAVYLKEIIKVKNLLEKNNIDYVFLKGLPLHLYYEKNPPRRLYADCDILVRSADFATLKTQFISLGYKIASTSLVDKKDIITELSFYKKINNVLVVFDIHIEPVFMMTQIDTTDYLYPCKLMDKMRENFLSHKVIITVDKQKYPILRPSELIIYLSLHFFHHNYKGAYRLEFIHSIISSYAIQKHIWKEIIDFIENYHLARLVYPVFVLLKLYYKTSIPSAFLEQIKPKSMLQKYITKQVVAGTVFNGESRLFGGIHRIILIFIMSPQPWYQKILILGSWDFWKLFFSIIKKVVKFS